MPRARSRRRSAAPSGRAGPATRTAPRRVPGCRAASRRSRRCAPASAGRRGRLRRVGRLAAAAGRACLRSTRSAPSPRRRCRRPRRAAGGCAAAGTAGRPGARPARARGSRGSRILVAQVDVDVLRLHDPRGDQQPLEHPVRIGLRGNEPVLERPGLALIGVDRDEARPRLRADEPPLPRRREARAAEPPQPRRLDARRSPRPPAVRRGAARRRSRSRPPRGTRRSPMASGDRGCPAAPARPPRRLAVASWIGLRRRRRRARVRSGRRRAPDHADVGARAGTGARPGAADAGQRARDESQTRTVTAGGAGLALLHHVEMVVEGGDLVDLGRRQAHLLGRERDEVAARDGRSGPGSGAGARSAGRAGAARHPGARGLRTARLDRPSGPSARTTDGSFDWGSSFRRHCERRSGEAASAASWRSLFVGR